MANLYTGGGSGVNKYKPNGMTNYAPPSYLTQNTKPQVIPQIVTGPNPGGLNNYQRAQSDIRNNNNPFSMDNFDLNGLNGMFGKDRVDQIRNQYKGGTITGGGGGGGGYESTGGGYSEYNPFADLYSQMEARENERYQKRKSHVESAFQSLLGNLQAGYNNGVETVNKNADKAQQEAYINTMLAEKDLPQQLSALGITGGASESTAAGIQNSYGQSRNATENSRAESIAQLLQQLTTAKSNLDAEKENQMMNLYDDSTNSLNSIAEKAAQQQAEYSARQFSAKNAAATASVKQAQDKIKNNPYYNYAKNAIAQGSPISDIETYLLTSGAAPADVYDLLKGFSILGG